jgi:retinol dehydrogenase 12
MTDKNVWFVTGAGRGMGVDIVKAALAAGHVVVATGRDTEAVAKAVGEADQLLVSKLDVTRPEDAKTAVAAAVERFGGIDVLVNNAGVVRSSRKLSPDGREMTMAINHFAPFLLTNLLLDRLVASAPARVVTTASDAHGAGVIDVDDLDMERKWSIFRAYGTSKLANILFTRELARRLELTAVSANCLHPGVIRTRLGRGGIAGITWRIMSPFMSSPRKGGARIVHVAADPIGAEVTGRYFDDDRPRALRGQAADDDLAAQLWERSAALVGLSDVAAA